MKARSLLVALGALVLSSTASATPFTPLKLRLPSAGMVGFDVSGAAALMTRRVAPPPLVSPAPGRRLKFIRSGRARSASEHSGREVNQPAVDSGPSAIAVQTR